MARSARRPEPRRRRRGLAAAAGAAVLANPIAVGGTTAFLVAFSFVSANALWYQPHKHPNALLYGPPPAEQDAPEPRQTSIRIEREADLERAAERAAEGAARPAGDARLAAVQAELAARGLYDGPVDGLDGPRTRAAIGEWRRLRGLAEGGVDAALAASLGLDAAQPGTQAKAGGSALSVEELIAAPVPTPRADATTTASVAAAPPDPLITQIQAGLKAFGNAGIELDGVAGPETRAAIREFQTLFGLPVTGEPDEALLAKMREVGLTN